MDVQDTVQGIQPLTGQVIPIRTVQETRPPEEFADAYVAEVNLKCASKVTKALDKAYPRDPAQPMNHLRRFARYDHLPENFKLTLDKKEAPSQTIFVVIPPPLPEKDALHELLAPFAPPAPEDTSAAQPPTPGQIQLNTTLVPLYPPINPDQAEKWSESMWPVLFNPAAPRATVAPPLQVLNRTRESIQPRAGRYLALANEVAKEAEQSGLGRGIGAVVVDPSIEARIEASNEDSGANWIDAVIAVAGDIRYSRRDAGSNSDSKSSPETRPDPTQPDPDTAGGPDFHALMRVVELIASKRRDEEENLRRGKPYLRPLEAYFLSQSDALAPEPESTSTPDDSSPVPEKFQKTEAGAHPIPKSPEQPASMPRIRSREHGGYLCTDLDVYLTHEPCLCCSMGLLLSRFRAVVFPRAGRMETGGLASEPVVGPVSNAGEVETGAVEHTPGYEAKSADDGGDPRPERNYYGLHWRKELNWRALGFEFVSNGDTESMGHDRVAFHA